LGREPDMGEQVEILLKTTADQAGTQQTIQGLKNVATEVKASSAAATEDSKNTEELANKTGFLSLKKTELKKLVRELGHEFPIAGMAGRMMMNPIVAGLSLGIMAFGAAKKALDDWNAELDATAAKNAGHDFLPGIEAKKAALEEGATAAAAFGESLNAIGAAEDAFSGKVKLAIDKLHEFIAAQAEVNSAAEGKEIADVNLKEKLGKMTGTQAIEQRGAIKERYRKIADDLKTKGENEALRLKEAELKHSEEQAPGLEFDAGIKRRAADELKARLASAKASLPGAQTALDAAEKEHQQKLAASDAAEDTLRSVQRMAPFGIGLGGSRMVQNAQAAFNKVREEAETAKQARDRQKRLVEQYQRDKTEIPEALLPGADSAARIAEIKATQNVQRIMSLEAETGTLRQTLPIRQEGRQVAGGLKDQTTAIEGATQIAEELKQGQNKEAQLHQQILSAQRSGGAVRAAALSALAAEEQANNRMAEELNRRLLDIEKRTQSLETTRRQRPAGE
jgi:hypothetical protein